MHTWEVCCGTFFHFSYTLKARRLILTLWEGICWLLDSATCLDRPPELKAKKHKTGACKHTHTHTKKERKWPPDPDRECAKGDFSWSCWISMHLILNTKAHVRRRAGIHCLHVAKSANDDVKGWEVFLARAACWMSPANGAECEQKCSSFCQVAHALGINL